APDLPADGAAGCGWRVRSGGDRARAAAGRGDLERPHRAAVREDSSGRTPGTDLLPSRRRRGLPVQADREPNLRGGDRRAEGRSMRLAAHQPQYLPWLGFFDKMDRVDRFVLLDTVQYKKNEWQNRNRIRTATGWQWLTVPVHYRFPMTIREVQIDEIGAWRRKHREALRIHHARSPFRDAVLPTIDAIFDEPFPSLAALNLKVVRLLAG